MKSRGILIRAAVGLGLLLATSQAVAAGETSFDVTGRYTAQRRPRIAVYDFYDTNSTAVSARYGASVQAMLVTFFKRKSQFVVIERQAQGLSAVLDEWVRNRSGQTNLALSDPTARQLLEKLDAIILGNVTLLDAPAAAADHQAGERIEIDAKLLSRADGRIIAAAQRNGPVACLRSIVERLGVALEQEYLRPYYGKLKFELNQPQNVQIFLTPILLHNALDEEKPPVERGATVRIRGDHDTVESWITDHTTYLVENVLSGWYSLRLERPGYRSEKVDPWTWVAHDSFGTVSIHHRDTGQPLAKVDPKLSRFVVHVGALTTETFRGDDHSFQFQKLTGSVQPMVKRQHLDSGFTGRPARVFLLGEAKLEINSFDPPLEYADDENCDQFKELPPMVATPDRTYVASGQSFDLDAFKGGRLVIEDYRGELLPAGRYHMTLWAPSYSEVTVDLRVRGGDVQKIVESQMVRDTAAIQLATTGSKMPFVVTLVGSSTRYQAGLPLNFTTDQSLEMAPVDLYTVTTNVPDLAGWSRTVDTGIQNQLPPVYDLKKDEEAQARAREKARRADELKEARKKGVEPTGTGADPNRVPEAETVYQPPIVYPVPKIPADGTRVLVKTRLTAGGHLEALGSFDPIREDLYVEPWVRALLDELLSAHAMPLEPEAGHSERRFWRTLGSNLAASAADAVASQVGMRPVPAPSPPEVAVEAPTQRLEIPRDAGSQLALLEQHLADLDLLVLSDEDMRRLQRAPRVASEIARFVDNGGALFAFVSGAGEYSDIAGASLVVKRKGKRTARFQLADGEVDGFGLAPAKKKKIKVKNKRVLPQLEKLELDGSWRVLAFTHGHNEPRILERGKRDAGGYVAIWADWPEVFVGPRGGTVTEVEAARTAVRRHVLEWARHQVRRRFGGTTERRATEPCASKPGN